MHKEKIPQAVRVAVWNKYIGRDRYSNECYIGCGNLIQQNNFECGYIISEKKGGKITMQNLRPICNICNKSIGTKNMMDFIEKYGFISNENINENISKWIEQYKKNADIYLQFLNENIETTDRKNDKIHCITLYGIFKNWFQYNNPDTKTPSNREFVNSLRKYKTIECIRIGNKTQMGITNVKVIEK